MNFPLKNNQGNEGKFNSEYTSWRIAIIGISSQEKTITFFSTLNKPVCAQDAR